MDASAEFVGRPQTAFRALGWRSMVEARKQASAKYTEYEPRRAGATYSTAAPGTPESEKPPTQPIPAQENGPIFSTGSTPAAMHRYEQITQIGKGSFGVVYKCRLKQTGQYVALKQISTYGKTPEDLVGIRQEIDLQKELVHPGIIRYFDSFEEDGSIIIVSELAQSDLYGIFQSDGPLAVATIQNIAYQIVSVMAYLHGKQIAHRDMKLQNVLISGGVCKICDFGFAKQIGSQALALQSIKGTPLYLAPEIAKGLRYNTQSDIWSCGVMFFEMACGVPPFVASDFVSQMNLLKDDSRAVPYDRYPVFQRSPALRNFVDCMLRRSPDKRWTATRLLGHPFLNEGVGIMLAKKVSALETYKDWYTLLRAFRAAQKASAGVLQALNTEAVLDGDEGASADEAPCADRVTTPHMADLINDALNLAAESAPPVILALLELTSVNATQIQSVMQSDIVSEAVAGLKSQHLTRDYNKLLSSVLPLDSKEDAYALRLDFIAYLAARTPATVLILFGLFSALITRSTQLSACELALCALYTRVMAVLVGCRFTWSVPLDTGVSVAFPYDFYVEPELVQYPKVTSDTFAFTSRAHMLAAVVNSITSTNSVSTFLDTLHGNIISATRILEALHADALPPYLTVYTVANLLRISTMFLGIAQFYVLDFRHHLLSDSRLVAAREAGDPLLDDPAAPGPAPGPVRINYDIQFGGRAFPRVNMRECDKTQYVPAYLEGFQGAAGEEDSDRVGVNRSHSVLSTASSDAGGAGTCFSYMEIHVTRKLLANVGRWTDIIFRKTREVPKYLAVMYSALKNQIGFNNGTKLEEGPGLLYDSFLQEAADTLYATPRARRAPGRPPADRLSDPVFGAAAAGSAGGPGAAPQSKRMAATVDKVMRNMGLPLVSDSEITLHILHLRKVILYYHSATLRLFTMRFPAGVTEGHGIVMPYAYFRRPHLFVADPAPGYSPAQYASSPAQDLQSLLQTKSKAEFQLFVGGSATFLSQYLSFFKTQLSLFYSLLPFSSIERCEDAFVERLRVVYTRSPAMLTGAIMEAHADSAGQLEAGGAEHITKSLFDEPGAAEEAGVAAAADAGTAGTADIAASAANAAGAAGAAPAPPPAADPTVQTPWPGLAQAGGYAIQQREGPDQRLAQHMEAVRGAVRDVRAISFDFIKQVFAPEFQRLFPYYAFLSKTPSPLAVYGAALAARAGQPGFPNPDEVDTIRLTEPALRELTARLLLQPVPPRGHWVLPCSRLAHFLEAQFLRQPNAPLETLLSTDPFASFNLYRCNVILGSTLLLTSGSVRMVVATAFEDGLLLDGAVSSLYVQKYVDAHAAFAAAAAPVPTGEFLYQGLPACGYVRQAVGGGDEDEDVLCVDRGRVQHYLDQECVRIDALKVLFNCAACHASFLAELLTIRYDVSDVVLGDAAGGTVSLSVVTMLVLSCMWLQSYAEEDNMRVGLLALLLRRHLDDAVARLLSDAAQIVSVFRPQASPSIVLQSLVRRVEAFGAYVSEAIAAADTENFGDQGDPAHRIHMVPGFLQTMRGAPDSVRDGKPHPQQAPGFGDVGDGGADAGAGACARQSDRYAYPADVQPPRSHRGRLGMPENLRHFFLSTGTAVTVMSVNNYQEAEIPVNIFYAALDCLTPLLDFSLVSCQLVTERQASDEAVVSSLANLGAGVCEAVIATALKLVPSVSHSLNYLLAEPLFQAYMLPCQDTPGMLDSVLHYTCVMSKCFLEVLPLFTKLSVMLNLSVDNSVASAFCSAYSDTHHSQQAQPGTAAGGSGSSGGCGGSQPRAAHSPMLPQPSVLASMPDLNKTIRVEDLRSESETEAPSDMVLSCAMLNHCSQCMADVYGFELDARYGVGGMDGTNKAIAAANWQWKYFASATGVGHYALAVRHLATIFVRTGFPVRGLTFRACRLTDKRLQEKVRHEQHVSGGAQAATPCALCAPEYNLPPSVAAETLEQFNTLSAFPLPEVLHVLSACMSEKSMESIVMATPLYGGGQENAEAVYASCILAIYSLINVIRGYALRTIAAAPVSASQQESRDTILASNAGPLGGVRSRNETLPADTIDMTATLDVQYTMAEIERPKRAAKHRTYPMDIPNAYMLHYLSNILVEHNAPQNMLHSLHYMRSRLSAWLCFGLLATFTTSQDEAVSRLWVNQFVIAGGLNINLLAYLFSDTNFANKGDPLSGVNEYLTILCSILRLEQRFVDVLGNAFYMPNLTKILSYDNSERVLTNALSFIGHLLSADPGMCGTVRPFLPQMSDLLKLKKHPILFQGLFALAAYAKLTNDPQSLLTLARPIAKVLLNSRLPDNIKCHAALCASIIASRSPEALTRFVRDETFLAIIEGLTSADDEHDQYIFGIALRGFVGSRESVNYVHDNNLVGLIQIMERDVQDQRLRALIMSIVSTLSTSRGGGGVRAGAGSRVAEK